MSTSLVINGVSYLYPDTGDQNWGTVASAWAAAVTSGMLQKSGGAFTLTADANFGANFGLLSKYFTSQSSNAAASGIVRLANTEAIAWRNNANGADVSLSKDSSDRLTYAGQVFLTSAGKVDLSTSSVTGVLPNANTTGTSAATASTLFARDASGNGRLNSLIEGYTTTATAAGTTTLTVASTWQQFFTGSTTQTCVLPDATTLVVGQTFLIVNRSSGVVTVNKNGGTLVQTMAANSQTWVTVTVIGTAAGSWDSSYGLNGSSSGTVTSVTFTGDGTVLSSTASAAVTTTGTLTAALKTQTKNTGLYGPTTGANAAPTFRAPVAADLSPAYLAPTVQKFTSGTGTYTTAAGALYIRVRMVGGGGGGGGATANTGGNGGNTTFGTTLLVANGGIGADAANNPGGAGGTASLGTGPIGTALTGGAGQGGQNTALSVNLHGGQGGNSFFGGAGAGAQNSAAGLAAAANTGAGGGGGSTGISAGPGGGAGGFVDAIISSPSATYSYAVGAAGAGASAGGQAGGAGALGYIEVTEYYQ